ncbi:TetR/AcrR family transcriptional regulator [Aquisalimonas sp. APHAB1-3]|uniref:TetR/AcrR family transcriptional regulator n=1 Tax=Aquisalimonas sp. APHAB1-3 TaxID=3402080 RepID=UPI003AAA6763
MGRDREYSEQRLIQAVGQILARDGFGGLGVNAVARAAGVDKVLIYRYFDGLPNLLRAYGEGADFWPTVDEVLGSDIDAVRRLPPEQRVEHVVLALLEALRNRPQTIEILAWEAVADNALTRTLANIREQWGRDVIARVFPDAREHPDDVLALANLMVAGFQYLMIRARKSPAFGGVDLRSEAGWERIRQAIRFACRA